jgi:hypothetical protein
MPKAAPILLLAKTAKSRLSDGCGVRYRGERTILPYPQRQHGLEIGTAIRELVA